MMDNREKTARRLHQLDAKSHNVTPPDWENIPEWAQDTYFKWVDAITPEDVLLTDEEIYAAKYISIDTDGEIIRIYGTPVTHEYRKAARNHQDNGIAKAQVQKMIERGWLSPEQHMREMAEMVKELSLKLNELVNTTDEECLAGRLRDWNELIKEKYTISCQTGQEATQ
jgi:hypothetical protein